MMTQVSKWIKACLLCQKRKPTFNVHVAESRPVHAFRPMDMLAMDIYGPLLGPDANTNLWFMKVYDLYRYIY